MSRADPCKGDRGEGRFFDENVVACPSLRLQVESIQAIKQDCKKICFYNIMPPRGGGPKTLRGCSDLAGGGGLIIEIELVKDGKAKGVRVKEGR